MAILRAVFVLVVVVAFFGAFHGRSRLPYVRCLSVGILTAALIGGCVPMLMIGELGGPIDFRLPLLPIGILGLFLAVYLLKTTGWIRGTLSGIAFALPISAFCLFAPRLYDLSEHARELRYVGISILVLSVMFMAVRAHGRRARPTPNP